MTLTFSLVNAQLAQKKRYDPLTYDQQQGFHKL